MYSKEGKSFRLTSQTKISSSERQKNGNKLLAMVDGIQELFFSLLVLFSTKDIGGDTVDDDQRGKKKVVSFPPIHLSLSRWGVSEARDFLLVVCRSIQASICLSLFFSKWKIFFFFLLFITRQMSFYYLRKNHGFQSKCDWIMFFSFLYPTHSKIIKREGLFTSKVTRKKSLFLRG